MLQADVCDAERVLSHPDVRGVLDFSRPVGVLMMFLLHLVPESAQPQRFVAAYRDALAPGSFLAISHLGTDHHTARTQQIVDFYRQAGVPFTPRPGTEIARFFGDFELVGPGLVSGLGTEWPFADPEATMFLDEDVARMGYAGIGRKVHT